MSDPIETPSPAPPSAGRRRANVWLLLIGLGFAGLIVAYRFLVEDEKRAQAEELAKLIGVRSCPRPTRDPGAEAWLRRLLQEIAGEERSSMGAVGLPADFADRPPAVLEGIAAPG